LSDNGGLKGTLVEFMKYGAKFDRALGAMLSGSVKECRFFPSRRKILTVVGRYGDEFIDPERPYCSCSDFYFKVTAGAEDTCYHLLSFRMAQKAGSIEVLKFDDEEFGPYLRAVVSDIFRELGKGGG
jgi:predicted nucleic acid-binding Zn finger protein